MIPQQTVDLTWPQLQCVLGIRNDSPAKPPAQNLTWAEVDEMARAEQARLFAGMAEIENCAVPDLADLSIDRLESLYLQFTGRDTVDRLKMRVCLLKHVGKTE